MHLIVSIPFFADYQKYRNSYMYTIIDIETTGGNFKNGKITEVAIYLHDGHRVVDEFVSLINPEQFIPPFISQLTGITNQMVVNAPKFYEVAKQIVEITKGSIFVAHNASFDYGFIKAEFEALGYDFDRETLCTVKLSRKLLPGLDSYSLGNICTAYGISNDARHRAAGDALATVQLFEILLDKNGGVILPMEGSKLFSVKGLHPDFKVGKLSELPHKVGVYYFYNDKGDLIYIGKSKDIKKRVLTHLGNPKAQKAVRMKQEVVDVTFELTGSELVALLKESAEIKKNKPLYNKTQKRNRMHFGLFCFKDRKGYLRFHIARNDGRVNPIASFESDKAARDFLFQKVEEYTLCQKLSGLSNSTDACFQYQIKQCKGACIHLEAPVDYNKRAKAFVEELAFEFNNFLMVDVGRDVNENSVVVVQDGRFKGFGWVQSGASFESLDDAMTVIQSYDDNQDARIIIHRYLKEKSKM